MAEPTRPPQDRSTAQHRGPAVLRGRMRGPASTTDQRLLDQRGPSDWVHTDPWRVLRIQAEFVEGFGTLAELPAAVTVFGSARTPVDHPDYAGNASRNAHRDALGVIIADRFKELTGAEAATLLAAVPVAHANVNTMADVWAHPQLAARGRWHEVSTPAGPVPALAPPGVVDPAPRMDPVPALGEHTRPILAELGFTGAEIDGLRAAGVT